MLFYSCFGGQTPQVSKHNLLKLVFKVHQLCIMYFGAFKSRGVALQCSEVFKHWPCLNIDTVIVVYIHLRKTKASSIYRNLNVQSYFGWRCLRWMQYFVGGRLFSVMQLNRFNAIAWTGVGCSSLLFSSNNTGNTLQNLSSPEDLTVLKNQIRLWQNIFGKTELFHYLNINLQGYNTQRRLGMMCKAYTGVTVKQTRKIVFLRKCNVDAYC